jgi:S-formylglutathione hydrolase FrmB
VHINPAGFAADPMAADPGTPDPEYDVHALAKAIAESGAAFPPIYDSCGTEDFLLASNQAFAAELTELGAEVTWKEVPGFGHEWRFWDQQVEAFLDWIPRDDVYAKMGKRSC